MKLESSKKIYKFIQEIENIDKNVKGCIWLIGVEWDLSIKYFEKFHFNTKTFNEFNMMQNRIPEPYMNAYLKGLDRVILCHFDRNYQKPSKDDFSFSRRQFDNFRKLNLTLLDYIIFGKDGYYSMGDEGTLLHSADEYDKIKF